MSNVYIEGSVIGTPSLHPAGGVNICNWSTATGLGIPSGSWQTIDITSNPHLVNIPGIKAVFLMGILIITNEDLTATADMHVAFQAPDAGYSGSDYSCQACIEGKGGIREPVGLWVPVVNNQFQCWWTPVTSGSSGGPTYYGASIAVNAYLR